MEKILEKLIKIKKRKQF